MRYGIKWPDGAVTVIGEYEYAKQLLAEASGPFPASLPAPAVVEVPEADDP